jgi:hypothetical protein
VGVVEGVHGWLAAASRDSFIGRRVGLGVESMLSPFQSEIQATGAIFKRVLQRVCNGLAGELIVGELIVDKGVAWE